MKKMPLALMFAFSWALSYAQSSTQLNPINTSIKIQSSSSSLGSASSNISISGATTNSSSMINANATNISLRNPSSSTIISSGAINPLPSAANTSNTITQASSTSTTVAPQNLLATNSVNASIKTTSPTTAPISRSTEKLVVVKTPTPPQTFLRPETPKPETIANLYKSHVPPVTKTATTLAPALSLNHGFEMIVRLSNKVNLAVASDALDTDSSTASMAKLVDTISSPHNSLDSEFALSTLKQ